MKQLFPFAIAAAAAVAAVPAEAAFTFTSGSGGTPIETMFNVRQPGTTGSLYDFGANLGNIEQFRIASPVPVLLTEFSLTQLQTTFPTFGDLYFSVSAASSAAVGTVANVSAFVTKPRAGVPDFSLGSTFLNPNSTAPNRANVIAQGTLRNRIIGVGLGHVDFGEDFSDTASRVLDTVSVSYTTLVEAGGNFGVAQVNGSVEGFTGATFNQTVYLDFYEVQPGSGPGTYLGAFGFSPKGDLTWYSKASVVPEPSTVVVGAGLAGLAAFTLARRHKA
jgi:hypothetical protein